MQRVIGNQRFSRQKCIFLFIFLQVLIINNIKQMSTDEYNKKLEEAKKISNSLKKDLKYRQEQEKRGQTTYSLDAEIKGSFNQLDEVVDRIQKIFLNFRANPTDFGLTNKEIQKRQQQYDQAANERTNLKRQYDSYFQKKSTKDLLGDTQSPTNKPDYTKLNSKQLLDHKQKQEKQQEEALDELINIVKNTKTGGKAIGQELKEQDQIINQLDDGMDGNIENMGRVRRNMTKLLEDSSNMCLVITIIIEVAAIFCIIFLWK